MWVIFFSTRLKVDVYFINKQKNRKKFVVFKIILFERLAVNSDYYEENTCQRLSMYEQSALGFHISLRDTFSK